MWRRSARKRRFASCFLPWRGSCVCIFFDLKLHFTRGVGARELGVLRDTYSTWLALLKYNWARLTRKPYRPLVVAKELLSPPLEHSIAG